MPKKALFVVGGWDGHTPRQSADLFAKVLTDKGYAVELSDTLDAYLDKDKLASMDLIVPTWTMGTITNDQEKGLLEAIASGTGLAGWHGCMCDSFRNNTRYQFMTGGQWVAHPGNCIPTYRVNITNHDHPTTKGLADFDLLDTEQYYMHVDPGVNVLAATTFSGQHGDPTLYPAGAVMPYAWTRAWGKGKVFYAAWGHTFKDFDVPQAKEIMTRGLLWATR
ncbi:MAG: ThuA domain-containing protein [Phycisphaeraceae bacterium]|nr:ThuA domain-containing protein [Phycisphaeraceae bacterium]